MIVANKSHCDGIKRTNGMRYPLVGGRGQDPLYRKTIERRIGSFWRREFHQSGAGFVSPLFGFQNHLDDSMTLPQLLTMPIS